MAVRPAPRPDRWCSGDGPGGATPVRTAATVDGVTEDTPTDDDAWTDEAAWTDDDARAALVAERDRSRRLLGAVERSMDDVATAREGSNSDDEHDPEGATLAWERGSLGAVRNDARRRLDLVDAALVRLDAGTYGRCLVGGEPIPRARLAAIPWAQTCVAHAD